MFRFAILVLAGIGLGAILFGGAPSAAAGIGFLALIPLLFLFKILLIATFFGFVVRRRFSSEMNDGGNKHSWDWQPGPWRRPQRRQKPDSKSTENDRFEDWHRMAHAKEEVDGWIDKPE